MVHIFTSHPLSKKNPPLAALRRLSNSVFKMTAVRRLKQVAEPLKQGGVIYSDSIKIENCAMLAVLFSLRRGLKIVLKNYTGCLASFKASLSVPCMASQLKDVASKVGDALSATLAPDCIRLRLSVRDFLLIVSQRGAFVIALCNFVLTLVNRTSSGTFDFLLSK